MRVCFDPKEDSASTTFPSPTRRIGWTQFPQRMNPDWSSNLTAN